MLILDKYIAKIIIQKITLVLVILSSLFLVFNFLDQTGDIGKGDYNIFKVSLYTLMLLPLALQDMFAIIILIGTMLGLGQLINNHELIAMRSSGFSSYIIIKQTIKVGIIISFILLLFNELFAFSSYHFAQKYRQQALGMAITDNAGTWVKYRQYFLWFKPYQSEDQHYTSMTMISIKKNRISQIDISNHVYYSGNRINLTNNKQYKINKIGNNTNVDNKYIKSQLLNFILPKAILDNIDNESAYLNTWSLWQQIKYLAANDIDNKSFVVYFYHRLYKPLLLISMIFVGLIFMLKNDRSLNIGKQVFLGIIFSFTVYIFNRLSSEIALALGYNIMLSVFFPVVILFVVSALLLWYRHKNI